jgi:hypothetical protein
VKASYTCQFRCDPACSHDNDPVSESENLLKVRRDHNHGGSSLSEFHDELVNRKPLLHLLRALVRRR